MSSNSRQNQMTLDAADQSLFDGLTKNASTLTSFLIASQTVPLGSITQALQGRLDALHASQSARATWQTAVQAEADERAKTKGLVSGVRQALQVMFAGAPDKLAQFGLKPRKPRTPLTSEQKAAAAAKAKATREARGTMGAKQKAKIKGTVAVPATTPAAPQPAAAPAAAAPVATPVAKPGS